MLRIINDDCLLHRAIENKDRTFEYVISTERADSHGTIIPIKSWDLIDFNNAGAFYWMHNTSGGFITDADPDNTLGVASAYKDGGKLIGVGTFETEDVNQLAEKIYKKTKSGSLKRTSVGFMGKGHWGKEDRSEDPTLYYFDNTRLLEFSIVNIGSNLDAIKRSIDDSMSAFMNKEIEAHKSNGFKKDYTRLLIRRRDETLRIII